jgi:TrpR-related protein YerC/YecD
MDEQILQSKEAKELYEAFLSLKTPEECGRFLRDVCTLKEIEDMVSRLRIARMLSKTQPKPFRDIAEEVGTSTTTVTRVAHWLNHGMGGYRTVISRIHK